MRVERAKGASQWERVGRCWGDRVDTAPLMVAAFLGLGCLSAPQSKATAVGRAADTTPPTLLSAVFQDHAVIQRDRPVVVWGQAGNGDVVTVSLGTQSARAQTDPDGHWQATLPALSAGGPLVLEAHSSSGASQSATDILVGDVFLCSGQSNMEMSVDGTGNAFNEIVSSTNSTIRMLTVHHASSPTPRGEFGAPVSWQLAAPATVPKWSATCFYFARELQKTQHVPIGLVHSSWGGSNIRPWLSSAAYHNLGGYDTALSTLALYAKDEPAAQHEFAGQWETWWRSKTGDRPGAEPWTVRSGAKRARTSAAPDDWQPAPAGLGDWRDWGVGELRAFTGLVWFRTHFTLTAAQAKSAVRLDLGKVNQVDETWLNGHAVGNTFGYDAERTYRIPAGLLHAGDNVLVINVLSTYGAGGLLAGGSTRALHFSSGESVPLQGAWEYRVVPTKVGYPPRAPWEPIGGVTTLYNAMIAPLGSYALRGVLWYQGESNTDEWESYQKLLGALMTDWRRQFGPDLPFLVVQLPNYGAPAIAPAESSGWASLREAQRAAVAADPHAGLAVTIDIGEPGNLHPTNKQDVGRRLARAARHVIYGESISASGPVAVGASWVGSQIVVDFSDIEGGLVARSHERPIGFELCGEGPNACRFAQSSIEGTKIVLPVPQGGVPGGDSLPGRSVGQPTHVRYCWADSPVCTLFDHSGLPAGPFDLPIRSDTAMTSAASADSPSAAHATVSSASADSASFDADGTAHITRVVPEPMMVSAEARRWLDGLSHTQPGDESLQRRRERTDEWRAKDSAEALKYYPVTIKETNIAGVRVDRISPLRIPPENRRRVLINLHGGGFNSDSGSRIEGDPIANLTRIEVVSVYYRLAPENPFPAAVDDVVAVYEELLKTYKPANIGMFGTSAGGILTCEVAVKLKQLGLPLPGALGVLSALGDYSRVSDTRQLFTLDGFPGNLQPVDSAHLPNDAYVGTTDRRDPVLSPLFADLHGMPPTLFISGTRDMLLGDTATLQRAMLKAGVDARLVVFDALPHAFWYHFELPETHEALQLLARFLDEKVAR